MGYSQFDVHNLCGITLTIPQRTPIRHKEPQSNISLCVSLSLLCVFLLFQNL